MLEDDLERAEEKLSSITSKLSTAETEKDEADRAVQRLKFRFFGIPAINNTGLFSLSISEGNASDKLMDLEQQLKEAKLLAEESDR